MTIRLSGLPFPTRWKISTKKLAALCEGVQYGKDCKLISCLSRLHGFSQGTFTQESRVGNLIAFVISFSIVLCA